uniref:Tetraspanin 13 n=1 Tax=Equus caballus TaxID=9796 RepID=A0A9L0SZ82_HORSE
MVCGGFACSKNCLCALNLLYTLVSLLLIGIAAWGIGFGLISSLRVVGVVIAVGIFLFLIALVGLIGAVKHHQSCFKSSRSCVPCAPIIGEYAGEVLRFVGGIGLFFSFTEILGVWLTYRYRNQKDPRANPSAFL